MSVFRCKICDFDYDSDYHEMYTVDEYDVCSDCYSDLVAEAQLE